MKTLTADERRIWSEAVAAYAGTLSTLSTLQMPMPPIAVALGDAKDAASSAQGNYSLFAPSGAFLVMSTNPNPANAGLSPLETVFHEGMHQWDREVTAALRAAAPGVTIPQDLSHALIFFTAGEAIRRVDPTHVPYVDRFGIWKGRLSGSPLAAERLQGPIQQFWKPYLDGRGTRDEALAGLVGAVTRSQP